GISNPAQNDSVLLGVIPSIRRGDSARRSRRLRDMIRRRLFIVDSRHLHGRMLTAALAGLLLGVVATAGIGQAQDPKNPPPGSTATPGAPTTPLPNPKQPTDNGPLPSPRSYGDRGTSSNVG